MIHQVYTQATTAVTGFGYLIIISIDFSVVLVLIRYIKHSHFQKKFPFLKVSSKIRAVRRILNSCLGFFKCGQTQSFRV